MPKVIGVRFRTSPRIYYFAPTEGEEYPKNTKVVVETQRGIELATVAMPETEVADEAIVAPLKPILRKATQADADAEKADNEQKQSILATAKQKVSERGLEMKIVDCEFTADHGKLVLYFTAEQRVDFRELVRDLASAFRMRIDLRQIGARDECKLIGTLGACGLPCCCGRFESDAEHVSIKMAKNQNLALTPNKINGMCGRLLCCLSYENKTYEDVLRRSPKHGATVTCPDGRRGTVVSVTPLTEKVRVRVGDDENFEFCEFTLDELGCDRREKRDEPTADGQARSAGSDGNNRNQNQNRNNNNRNGGERNNRKDRNNRNGKNKFNGNGETDGNRNGGNNAPVAPQNQNGGNAESGGTNNGKGGGKKNRNRNRFNKNKNNGKQNGDSPAGE